MGKSREERFLPAFSGLACFLIRMACDICSVSRRIVYCIFCSLAGLLEYCTKAVKNVTFAGGCDKMK